MDAIKAAYDSGEYDVLIIDGISPEWDDAGGVLQTVDELTRRFKSEGEKAATRNAWSVVTPAHKKFINTILRTRLHVICTMRAKKETIAEKDDKGRPIGKKVVMEAIQREDVPYVFDVMGILTDKDMIIDKTRCPDLDDQIYHKPGQEVANIIREWLKGEPLPERLGYAPDLDEQHRIVDAPVDRSTHVTDGNGQKPLASVRSATVGGNGKTNATTVEEGATDAPATDQQLTSIRKLCQHLGKPEPEHPETMSYQDAKALITQLSHEYNEQKQHRKAS
jgi:hypothetical protein